jgi:DNA end-binding protein Ku
MKSIWKGSISFGLVTIRVRLYSAVQEHVIGFKLLCKTCHTPITYERRCEHCNKAVAWSDVVKGLKMEDGSYFILTQEKINELKPKTTETIDVVEFVKSNQIEPIYLEHHYYLGPEKDSQKAFFLFQKALQESGQVAVGTFVMRDKQYTCIINPYSKAMLLSTLYYAYEIRDIDEVPNIDKVPAKIDTAQMKLALQLIEQLAVKKFDLDQFKDTFAQQLKEAIKKGKKTSTTRKKKKEEAPVPSRKRKSEDALLTALRASLKAPGRSAEVAHARRAKKS